MASSDGTGSARSSAVDGKVKPRDNYLFSLFKCIEDASSMSPCARSGHCAMLYGTSMIVFGGYFCTPNGQGKNFSGVFVYDLILLTWKKITCANHCVPKRTASSGACFVDGELFVFGGSGEKFGSSTEGNCFKFDFGEERWSKVPPQEPMPTPVYGHGLTYCAESDELYSFGGTTGYSYINTVFSMSLETNTWSEVACKGPAPKARYSHRLVACDDCFYVVFGGTGGADPLVFTDHDRIYRFCYSNHSWSSHPCHADPTHGYPRARRSHTVASNSEDVIMCGGEHVTEDYAVVPLDDIWRLQLPDTPFELAKDGSYDSCWQPMAARWWRLPVSLPNPTYFHSAVLTESGCLCVFGGNILTDSGTIQRVNKCIRVYVNVPSLAEIAWRCLNAEFPEMRNLPNRDRAQMCLPRCYWQKDNSF
ncbi:kelch domain-containing protein 10-like [Sycon ciliatum]|uniref:kelch domain-containing protein 10-like n=1 Tax=Sycon ciliatum TaxID=27933 RepID=UPI0031F65158